MEAGARPCGAAGLSQAKKRKVTSPKSNNSKDLRSPPALEASPPLHQPVMEQERWIRTAAPIRSPETAGTGSSAGSQESPASSTSRAQLRPPTPTHAHPCPATPSYAHPRPATPTHAHSRPPTLTYAQLCPPTLTHAHLRHPCPPTPPIPTYATHAHLRSPMPTYALWTSMWMEDLIDAVVTRRVTMATRCFFCFDFLRGCSRPRLAHRSSADSVFA